jgi:hypothetical protein
MGFLVPLLVSSFLIFLVIVAGMYVTTRWLFLWTTAMVSAGIDRTIARLAVTNVTRLGAYALARDLTEQEAARRFSQDVDRLAWWTEGLVRLPLLGPVGLDALLGLVPFAGDALSAWIGLRLVARGMRYGLPPDLVSTLLANVLTDVLLGAIPIAGDLADIWFRSNTRNATLIRNYLGSTIPPAPPNPE